MKKPYLLIAFIFFFAHFSHAQWGTIGDRIGDDLSRKAQQKVEDETNNAADKAYDKSKQETKDAVKNGSKNSKNNKGNNTSGNTTNNSASTNSSSNSGSNSGSSNSSSTPTASFKSYSKYDFVPGEKVIAVEDFMQDATGDFPDKWNTNGSGEIVTINGKPGHWLQLTDKGISYPEFITDLPENFTFEYDLACNPDLSYYSPAFSMNFVALTNDKQYQSWGMFPGSGDYKINGVRVYMHPQNAGNNAGMTGYRTWENGDVALQNETGDLDAFYGKAGHNMVHVAVWRQKQRMRVYINEEKVWDIPKAFQTGVKYNKILFNMDTYNQPDDKYSFTNLKLAVGAPDTRNKLITEGKFVTRGILFDVNSANIKPESYGVLKDIASVLTENPDLKVKIIGHTDSDGDDASNLELSKKRSDAVKTALIKNFGIDASRMTTDGKGESQPVDVNTTTAGKANNRRVEFIKT